MTTKAELIRKLAKRSGIPDQESKLFFEIFLKRAAEVLKTGSALFIKQYGCFQMKRAKIKNVPGLSESENEPFYTDLLVFTDENTKEEDGVFFNIPLNMAPDFNPLDAYFSISIGKPVIPLRKIKNEEFLTPPAGPELRRLIESKVDRLLSEIEVVEDFGNGNEVILIDASKYDPDQFELNWSGSISQFSASASEKQRGEGKAVKNIPWDFGEDLSKQIEEESILDLTDSERSLFNEPEESKQRPVSEASDEPDDFQEVKPIARDLVEPVVEEEVNEKAAWDFSEDEPATEISPDLEEEEISEGFSQVKFKTATQQFNVPADLNFIPESDEEFSLEDQIPEEEIPDNSPEMTDEPINEEPLSDEPVAPKTRRWLFLFVVAGFFLVAAASYFIYVNLKSITGNENTEDKKIIGSVINRSYDVPVSYPYNKSGDTIASQNQPIKLSALSQSASMDSADQKALTEVKIDNPSPSLDVSAVQNKEKVKEFIYKYGSSYLVQVSSWPGRNTAESEASRFERQGMSAVVEKVYIAGRGNWYRVLVGSFSSLKEAEDFQKKQN